MNDVASSGAELLVRCLETQGVERLFCIPGAKVDKVVDCLVDSTIETIVCRHEQNAALMAQATGRLTGKAGVCLVTSGPGCTNLTTGLATADYEGDPVVALGGSVPLADRLKLSHQSLDAVSLFRPITKFAAEVTTGHGVTEAVASAFRGAEQGRPGAAFLALPKDVMEGPAPFASPSRTVNVARLGSPDADDLREVAALIEQAEVPVLFLGMLATEPRVAEAVRELLRKTAMPVICTYQGAGVVPRDLLPCFAGRVGLSRNQPGDQLLDAADLVLTVGFDPIEYDPGVWNRGKSRPIVHFDKVPAETDADYWPMIELVGETASALTGLASCLAGDRNFSRLPQLVAARGELAARKELGAKYDGSPIHPLRLIHEIQQMMGDEGTVICDVGSIYMWMSRYYFAFNPRHFLTSNGQQTLGVALPWAIATCLVRPGTPILSMSGDGGFLFSAQELETAVRLKANFVHLVWVDGSYDMVKIQQEPKYGRSHAVELGPVDHVRYAEAFGATGLRIANPSDIRPTLVKAFGIGGPVLVEIPIDYRDNPTLFESVHPDIGH
ncbi:Acetolactate synthase, catabolic [Planctomycetes bacterium Pan216]|uniref:Acetolactate synthase, catabolic n=1 Tax=Kolteria novifilia TaxID=2527975 RepID=A0A518B1R4_9BACT|nr:Acetolactate synthase, catabolic [Planctomycetes bacterium Pan216]